MASERIGPDARRLRLVLGLFFLALAAPTAVLVYKAYDQLKWEVFHQFRTQSEELGTRIDRRLAALIAAEQTRPFGDYGFLAGADPETGYRQPSPLSLLPIRSDIPGLIGWFQVDADGTFRTPLLPSDDGTPLVQGVPDLVQREAIAKEIRGVLTRNRLVDLPADADRGLTTPDQNPEPRAEETFAAADEGESWVSGQAAFDRLQLQEDAPRSAKREKAPARSLGQVEDLKLDLAYQRQAAQRSPAPAAPAPAEKERTTSRVEGDAAPAGLTSGNELDPGRRVRMFESEIDPFALSLLDSGHFVLFRKVWREGARYIQGAVIAQEAFLRGLIADTFAETALSRVSDLTVAYRGAVLAVYGARPGRDYLTSAGELTGALLHRLRLSAPAGDLELLFSISRLPAGPGASVVGWLASILASALVGGFYLLYRLGLRQIALTRQQQDFVSAVSHELKTPLTSIRMYGEMLREGWAPEERKQSYYEFILNESERLSRLINNVLQLARLTRNELAVDLKPRPIRALMEDILPRLAVQAEQAGFTLRMDCPDAAEGVARVDEDFLTQILINLVDNALKFSRDAERREVVVGCARASEGEIRISVRDFGPGVPPDQRKKIFRLFYRAGSELTRETVGTGIGLALVRQLTLAMKGRVDLVNREPGAEFRVLLPLETGLGKV